jgi:hypothetical protein
LFHLLALRHVLWPRLILFAAPLSQLADRIIAFLRESLEDHQALIAWRERNRHALREFWARAPADGLGGKQEFERALAQNGNPR